MRRGGIIEEVETEQEMEGKKNIKKTQNKLVDGQIKHSVLKHEWEG